MNEGRKRAVWINISVVVFSLLLTTCVGSFSLMWIQRNRFWSPSKQCAWNNSIKRAAKLNYLDERLAQAHQPIALQTKVSHRQFLDERRIVLWFKGYAGEAMSMHRVAGVIF